MRVEVDLALCEANAVCTGIAPDVFELDDEDVLHIRVAEPSADRADDVRFAVASCPKLALSLSED
ncbi:MAG: ferredoxin [Streptosporangiaceae bacterium]